MNQYAPDSVSAPGETLAEVLQNRGISQTQLADIIGVPAQTIAAIVQGQAALTPDMALQLERVLCVPARFWIQREKLYREAKDGSK